MASPMLKEKQQPANGIPHKLAYGIYAAPTALTGIKSVGRGARTPPQVRAATRQRAATHVGGGVPDAPETSRHRPSPGKTPGRACPAPTARRCGKPYAVRKRPRRGQDPSLRTDPSASARPLPRGGGQALCRPQTPAEGSRPLPTDRPINACPPPPRGGAGTATKNRGDPFYRDCLGSLYKHISA